MSKKYSDYIDEISADDLYEGLLSWGLFADKLPPIFYGEEFYKCVMQGNLQFSQKEHDFIFFESMRDINIPRQLGIPNPIAYQKLCECLRNNWKDIQRHFHDTTDLSAHKISRIHIRKQSQSKALFKMNYKDWKNDDSPVTDILIGKKYMVCADISTCFPSMYTHALCWALMGKETAKSDRKVHWANELDHRCMELRSGETHGFLIGPHASNLLSEIILTVVDKALCAKGWKYIRNIDDYTCYVTTYEKAQEFLTDLGTELRRFDLPLNHKKTKIEELPVASTKHWVRQLNAFDFSSPVEMANYKKVQAYLDAAIGLMEENENSAAIINYAIKVLGKQELTENAKKYCSKTILHLAFIYPYLIPLLDEYVFSKFGTSKDDIKHFAVMVYDAALSARNYEAVTYSIFFAIKYDFEIPSINADDAVQHDSCLYKCCIWLYYMKHQDTSAIKKLKAHAKSLIVDDMDRNWLFVYESLPKEMLHEEWKGLKTNGVSFIRPEFR